MGRSVQRIEIGKRAVRQSESWATTVVKIHLTTHCPQLLQEARGR
jgi:hypothetical protein